MTTTPPSIYFGSIFSSRKVEPGVREDGLEEFLPKDSFALVARQLRVRVPRLSSLILDSMKINKRRYLEQIDAGAGRR